MNCYCCNHDSCVYGFYNILVTKALSEDNKKYARFIYNDCERDYIVTGIVEFSSSIFIIINGRKYYRDFIVDGKIHNYFNRRLIRI